MSYRERSYRKMSRAVAKANQATATGERPDLARHEMCRVLHWSNRPALPKLAGWGVQRHRCRQCGTRIGWVNCPTGGWWAHDVHPSDDHDAVRRAA